jgi:mandelate racemase
VAYIPVKAVARALRGPPGAPWIEHLDIAGAVLTEPIQPSDGAITARGPRLGMDWDKDAVKRFAA